MTSVNKKMEFRKLVEGEGALKNTILTGLAETLGTAILVFIGCMGCIGSFGVVPSHLQISLTFGLAVMVVIQCFGHISEAHINPAITIGSVILGRKTIPEAIVYFIAQIIGSIMGFGMLKVLTPEEHLTAGGPEIAHLLCVTNLHKNLHVVQGFLMEVLSTSILMFLASSLWDRRNSRNTDSVAIKFGLAVTVLATAVGPYTGCSMNPVRSLGPAVWNNQWENHWIYWFGPIAGAIFTSFAYRTVFGVADENDDETIPETVALNSVSTQKREQI